MESLFLLFLAHTVADFLLQSERIVNGKVQGDLRAYRYHGLIVLASMAILTHVYVSWPVLEAWLLITAAHLGLDWMKNRLCSTTTPLQEAWGFILEQGLHLVVIFLVWEAIPFSINPFITELYRYLQSPKAVATLAPLLRPPSTLPGWKVIVVTLVTVYTVFGGAVLIRKLLDAAGFIGRGTVSPPLQQGVGKYIGMLERLMIITLTAQNAVGSIAFILTAKSVARFKELENREFAEYYLTGTLASTTLALIGGLLIRWVLTL